MNYKNNSNKTIYVKFNNNSYSMSEGNTCIYSRAKHRTTLLQRISILGFFNSKISYIFSY